jgi:hypothetical protein
VLDRVGKAKMAHPSGLFLLTKSVKIQRIRARVPREPQFKPYFRCELLIREKEKRKRENGGWRSPMKVTKKLRTDGFTWKLELEIPAR